MRLVLRLKDVIYTNGFCSGKISLIARKNMTGS